MRTFTDRKGVTWEVEVNVTTVERVEAEADTHLLNLQDDGMFAELVSNEVKLVHVLWAICRPQAEKLGISPEEFGSRMAGEVIDAAYAAFFEEWADFFRSPARRAVLKKALQRVEESLQEASKNAIQALDRLPNPNSAN